MWLKWVVGHGSYGNGISNGGGDDLFGKRRCGVSVSDFVFGCGRNNKGLFGGVSGLMGLGRSAGGYVSLDDMFLLAMLDDVFWHGAVYEW